MPALFASRRAMPRRISTISISCSTGGAGCQGPAFGLADIAAVAQISVADYLGGIEWDGHDAARTWYSALKSRPTFRPMLGERMEGLPPPAHYDKLDF
jgi:glutathione S-transferase